jgi:hypothetical protein
VLRRVGRHDLAPALLDIVLDELEWRYAQLSTAQDGRATVRDEYQRALVTLGQRCASSAPTTCARKGVGRRRVRTLIVVVDGEDVFLDRRRRARATHDLGATT